MSTSGGHSPARGDAEAANRAKSDFLAMSHELRTPLNAIAGYAELIEFGIHGPVTDAQRNALNRIARSQAHLLTLINDVLNFARVDAGQIRYVVEDVRMHETLAGIEPLVEPQIAARKLTFQYEQCDRTIISARIRLPKIILEDDFVPVLVTGRELDVARDASQATGA